MSSLKCVINLLTAIVTANLIALSKQVSAFIIRFSPNYNSPSFEVKSENAYLNILCILHILM